MAWRKEGEVPKKQRVTIIVDAEQNPEVARMIYAIPYGGINRTLIQLLEKALGSAGGAGTAPPKVKADRVPQRNLSQQAGSRLGETKGRDESRQVTLDDVEAPPVDDEQTAHFLALDPDTARLVLEMNS